MTEQHPMPHLLEPTDEQVGRWLVDDGYSWDPSEQAVITITPSRLKNVARQAAQWGADQELEACCDWLNGVGDLGPQLRSARRPKPPSLKEQSIALIDRIQAAKEAWNISELETIRRALEQLPDHE
jgi:hypothetical protein